MATSTQLPPSPTRSRSKPFQIQNRSLDLPWPHRALRLHHLRSSPDHRLSDVPRLPSAGHRRPPAPHPAYALRHDGSPHRSDPVLITISPASPQGPSRPRPHLRLLCLHWRRNRGRPRQRPSGLPRNLDAGCRLGRLHHRRPHHRAQPPDHPAPPMDGPLLRRHLYLRLQPCAEPLAPLLEPPRGLLSRRRRDRLYSCLAAYR